MNMTVMQVDGGGGAGGVQPTTAPPVCTSGDPKVQEAVNRTVKAADFGPEPGSAAAYQIQQVMNDPSLTQAQKDEYIAALIELSNGGSNGCGSVSDRQAESLRKAFNEIGNASGSNTTPQLRQQVTDAIARGVADGRLDSNDLYGIVKTPGAAGGRQLLTGIRDGGVLSALSQRLLSDAKQAGYDINKYQRGPELLTAATDIANMAAAQGNRSAANAVLGEIDRVMKQGPVAGDMTLVQAMMATSLNSRVNLPDRDGFHALAGLLDSSASTPANQMAQDRLFAALARSGNDRYVGGIDQAGERAGALNKLGEYFERNFARLAETDWRKANTGDFHHGLIKDFMRQVLLDKDYGRVDQTNEVLATEMRRLAGQVGDKSLPPEVRENAASSLGAITGSLQWAVNDFKENAQGSAEAKTEFLRFFTDKLTGKLASKAGPVGGMAVNKLVDDIWAGITDWMASGEIDRGDGVAGGVVKLSQIIRDAMSGEDAGLLNAFDLRVELYHDPQK